MWLFALFIAVPLIEIALFIQVGGLIGLWWTLVIVIVTAVLGTYLVRQQGIRALGDLQESFNQLQDPTEHLAHGAMILFSGALLLTPGFFTDAVGFSLLIPGIRLALFRYIRSRIKVQSFTMGATGQHKRYEPEDVIDGEFEEVPSEKPNLPGNSGWTRH